MKKIASLSLIVLVMLTACNKTKTFSKRLTGKWKFTKFEVNRKYNNQADPNSSYSVDNTGSVELKDDKSGTLAWPTNKQGLLSTLTVTDWYNSDADVNIDVKDVAGSNTSFQFMASTNEKSSQVWEHTDIYFDANGGKSESAVKITMTKE
jgi:hypothetical protein